MRVYARAAAIGVVAVALTAGGFVTSPASASPRPTFRGGGTATIIAGFIQLDSEGVVTSPGGGTGSYKFSYKTTFAAASPGTFLLTESGGTANGGLRAVVRNTGFDGRIRYVLTVEKVTGTIGLLPGQLVVASGRVDFSLRDPFRWREAGTLTARPLADPV